MAVSTTGTTEHQPTHIVKKTKKFATTTVYPTQLKVIALLQRALLACFGGRRPVSLDKITVEEDPPTVKGKKVHVTGRVFVWPDRPKKISMSLTLCWIASIVRGVEKSEPVTLKVEGVNYEITFSHLRKDGANPDFPTVFVKNHPKARSKHYVWVLPPRNPGHWWDTRSPKKKKGKTKRK